LGVRGAESVWKVRGAVRTGIEGGGDERRIGGGRCEWTAGCEHLDRKSEEGKWKRWIIAPLSEWQQDQYDLVATGGPCHRRDAMNILKCKAGKERGEEGLMGKIVRGGGDDGRVRKNHELE